MSSSHESVEAGTMLQIRDKKSTARGKIVCVLSIAGSDSAGCAGAQADLRTFAALGMHGLSALTAVTAQSTSQVVSVHRVPAAQVERQLHAVFGDFAIGAVKIGMLGSAATIRAVAGFLNKHCRAPIVLDPVLVSSSGRRLLAARALTALREELIPLADMLTPNMPEAAALLGRRLVAKDGARHACDLLELGAKSVLLKGGHHDSDPVCDYLVDAGGAHTFCHARLPVQARGTGCVLSAAVAAGLAKGLTRLAAVHSAEDYLQAALRHSYRAGKSAWRVLPAWPNNN